MIAGRQIWLGFAYALAKGRHQTAEQPGVEQDNVTLRITDPGHPDLDLLFPAADWAEFVRQVNAVEGGPAITVVGADGLKMLRAVVPPPGVNGHTG